MKITREHLLNALGLVALAGAIAWFVANTEWVDEEIALPPRGEAAHDRQYALKQIVAKLGAKVVAPLNLERVPPPGATLLLRSWYWNMFPGRAEALRQWVEAGGHLVVDDLVFSDEKLLPWIPIRHVSAPAPASAPLAKAARPAASAARIFPPRGMRPSAARSCSELVEPAAVPPAFDAGRTYRVCGAEGHALRTDAPVLWALETPQGRHFLRVGVGRGQVTVFSAAGILDNQAIFQPDHALAIVAALGVKPGGEVWFVTTEDRSPLLTLIWRHGAPAVLVLGLALALALWRGGVRFGPRAPAAVMARRSVAEQIRGTANFIVQRDGSALHRAQLRALGDAARRHIREHDRLDRRSRADAIARSTSLDANALSRAMDTSIKRSRRELPATLALLESARRRLAPSSR